MNKIYVDEIYAFKGNDRNNKINDLIFNNSLDLNIEIDYDNGGIKAPEKVKIYLENIYKDYIQIKNVFLIILILQILLNIHFFIAKIMKIYYQILKKVFLVLILEVII